MIPMRLFPRGDGMADDIPQDKIIEASEDVRVGALAAGTESGRPSIGIFARMPDGRYVFIQTTLRLFLTAADTFKAVHGDPRT